MARVVACFYTLLQSKHNVFNIILVVVLSKVNDRNRYKEFFPLLYHMSSCDISYLAEMNKQYESFSKRQDIRFQLICRSCCKVSTAVDVKCVQKLQFVFIAIQENQDIHMLSLK